MNFLVTLGSGFFTPFKLRNFMRAIILILTTLILSSCTTFSQKDLIEIKKVAIVTGMQDSLLLYEAGVTKFGDSLNQVDISNWKLVDRISNQVAIAAKAKHPEIEFVVIDRMKYPYKPDYGSIAKIAKEMKNEGYDTLLLITNAGIFNSSTGTQIVPSDFAGFIIWKKSFFGKDMGTSVSAQYRLDLIKIEDNRFLKTAGTKDIYGHPNSTLSFKPYDQYTQDEKNIIKKELINHIDTTITKNTVDIFTTSTR